MNVDSVVRTLLARGLITGAVHGCRDRRHQLRHNRRAARAPRHQLARRAAAHLAAPGRHGDVGQLRRGVRRRRSSPRPGSPPRACGCRRCSRTPAWPRAASPSSLIVEGRVARQRRGRDRARFAHRSRERPRSTSTAPPCSSTQSKRYVMLNKPTGVVSSMKDDRGRPDLRRYHEGLAGAPLQRRAAGCRDQRTARPHQRRRAGARARPPVVRRHEGLHRQGRGPRHPADDRRNSSGASSSRTAPSSADKARLLSGVRRGRRLARRADAALGPQPASCAA